jgi:hypothetical protein
MADKYTIANPFYNSVAYQTNAPPHSRVFGGETSADYDKTGGSDSAVEAVYAWFPVGTHRYYVLDRRGACAGEYDDVDNGGGRAVHLRVEYQLPGGSWETLGTVWFVHLENVQVSEGSYYNAYNGSRVLIGYTKRDPSVCATGQHVHVELTAEGDRTAVLYTGDVAAYGDMGHL